MWFHYCDDACGAETAGEDPEGADVEDADPDDGVADTRGAGLGGPEC